MKRRIVQALAGLLVLSFACRAAAEDYEHYTRYVESDGTQSIDLGFTLSSDMTIECVYEQLYKGGLASYQGLFGARTDASTENISAFSLTQDFNVFCGECQTGGNDSYKTYRARFDRTADSFYLHRNLIKRTPTEGWTQTDLTTGQSIGKSQKQGQYEGQIWNGETFSTAETAMLFEIRGTAIGGGTWSRAAMRLYLLRVSDSSGKVLHEIIPGQEGDRVGVYDTVTGNYLYPTEGNPLKIVGTTPLSVQIDPSEPTIYEWGMKSFVTAQMPSPDTTTVTTVVRPINVGSQSYVESDGTQEIDLGFKLKSDMNIEVVFAGVGAVPASQGFFGARGSGANDLNIALFRGKHAEGKIVSADCQNGSYDTYRMADSSAVPEVIYRATLKDGAWTQTNETSGAQIGRSKKAWDGASFETPGNAMLFRINGTTIDDSAWARAKVRIYSVVVRDKDGTLLHDLVPSVNEAGVAGLFDRASADAANAWKFPAFGNRLTFVGARFAPDAPRAYTNVVGRVDESCKLPVTIRPLRPGTTYEWFAFAEDQRGDFVSSPTTNTFTTVADAAPAGATLSLKVEVRFGMAKAGHLRLRLTRTDTANAAAVTLVAGKDYGGADPANWRNVMACGSFAAGEAAIVVDTPFLPKDTNYLRAFTADGEWSETVLIPETGFVPGKQGLAVIFR